MSIFVGNLPFRAEREDVTQLFAPFGEVLNCSLPLERDTGRKRGFAFIEMADESIESKAIDGLQGTELMGIPLRINKKPKLASNIIFSLIPYIEAHLSNGGKSWDICKHLINLVEGIPKAKILRNQISTKSIKKELNIEYLFKLTTALEEMGY